MSVEILSNQVIINEREQRVRRSVEEFEFLIEKRFEGEGLAKVKKALDLMLEIHLPQKDRSDGNPYVKHPLEVAEKVLKISDNITPDLIVSALLHDSVEDMPEILFAKRANRKFPNRNYKFKIDQQVKDNYFEIFKDWSFKEIDLKFGPTVLYYIKNLTNHDFDSLAEDVGGLTDEEKIEFKNKAYASHVEEIIKDPNLCLLKYADFSQNINLKNLPQDGEKYFKLKRKYSSVIPIFIEKLNKTEEGHQLFSRKKEIIDDLKETYQKQYN